MLSRADFVFTIGYDGPAAIVDGQAKKRYAALSSRDLAEKGLFRAAYSSALYSGNNDELDMVIEIYNRSTGQSLTRDYTFERLFGVFTVDVKKAVVL